MQHVEYFNIHFEAFEISFFMESISQSSLKMIWNMTRMTLGKSFFAKLTSWRTKAAGNEVADMLNTTIDER